MLPKWLLILTVSMLLGQRSLSHQDNTATLRGCITDADSGHPLADAIVFLANTPIGTSTQSDGGFTLANVPAGDYELVVSRVGYVRRSVHIRLGGRDTSSHDIRLVPQPVRTEEVEVRAERAVQTPAMPKLLFPGPAPDCYTIYGTSSAPPIGIFTTDSAFYMYSLDTAIVDSEKYMRLWLLYKNISSTPSDFDPLKSILLHVKGRKHSYHNIPPLSRAELWAVYGPGRARAMTTRPIFEPIDLARAQQQLALSAEERFTRFMGSDERQSNTAAALPARRGLLSGVELEHVLAASVADTLLGSHVVYPGNSVNGYVFFPFPGLNWYVEGSGFDEAFDSRYEVEIFSRVGSTLIQFSAY